MTIPIISDLEVARAGVLRRAPLDEDQATAAVVTTILADVRSRGDTALRELTARFDGVERADFEIPRHEWIKAAAAITPELRAAIELAVAEIRRFHQRQARNSWIDFSVEGARGQLVVRSTGSVCMCRAVRRPCRRR